MKDIFAFFDQESDNPSLDVPACAKRLSAAIQCRTVNDGGDGSAFRALHALIRESFPRVMAQGALEIIGRSMLITLTGADQNLRPCLFMAHLDVVPVVEGTEDGWTYPPFSGAIAGGYLWGRGALDIKNQVFGVLEAAEYLLAQGKTLDRTLYLAFGEDEETFNTGAQAISDRLKSRGVTLEFVLDEGLNKLQSGADYGAPEVYVSHIGLMEKGYADLRLSVQSTGGHSSCPFGGTSLGQLAGAIAGIVDTPFPAALSPLTRLTFSTIAPYVTQEPLRTLVKNVDANAEKIAAYCMENRNLFPDVTTTIAPTVIRGSSSSCNVMPQNMEAVINFRIAWGQSPEEVMKHCRGAVSDPRVSMEFLQANGPSAVARADGYGYSQLCAALERYYKNIVFLPAAVAAATDAHCYEQICDTCLRCSPFLVTQEEADRGIHGTDERIPIRTYAQGIRTLAYLMERTCFAVQGGEDKN